MVLSEFMRVCGGVPLRLMGLQGFSLAAWFYPVPLSWFYGARALGLQQLGLRVGSRILVVGF